MDSLEGAGYRPVRISLPAGETGKTWAVLGDLLERLAEEGLSRGDLLVVLGGGSACDVGGLAAALYHRGMDVAYLATTLLAGVDAAIGGKTAVDLPAGKNLAGVIRQPLAVLIDPDSLKTLPPLALADGMAEAIKTGVLAGEELWPLVAAPEPDYEAILCGCAAYKAAIVSQEAQDTGIRLFLNLGHTIGHAVERHSGYALSHGQAVAIGLAGMARAGAALGWCDSITAERIKTALKRRGLPLRYRCRPEELDEERFSGYLFTDGLPDPELIIRTSGEERLSGFLLWQCAYSELYFCDTLWPDFGPEDMDRAIVAYQQRDRRFGGVK